VFVDGGGLEVEGSAKIDGTRVSGNSVTAHASDGIASAQGGGLFTAFPVILEDSSVIRNSPDQCVGC